MELLDALDTHDEDESTLRRAMARFRRASRILGRDAVAHEVRVAIFHARRCYDASHGASFNTYAYRRIWKTIRVALDVNARRATRIATRDSHKVRAFVQGSVARPTADAVRAAFPDLRHAADDDVERVIDWCLIEEVRFGTDEVEDEGAESVERATHDREANEEIVRLGQRLGLDAIEWLILRERILADVPKSRVEVGAVMGVTNEWIRQKERAMLSRMRAELLASHHPWVEHIATAAT